ncbi:hypothetical protein PG991_011839 [Apiospora marii]|uniref:Acyl-CoA dehydrogenase C-terminal domain-containing protein n=1 Tax=Apiospora marii TaxID=335849 RepID=A0ABR1RGG0_9PEZI
MERKNLSRKEGSYYDLVECPKGGLYHFDMIRLTKRCCDPSVAGQAAPLISCGQPSSELKKIVAYMKKYICDSDSGPRFVTLFCDILGYTSAKDQSTVSSATGTACEMLCELQRAILRNFHNLTAKGKPPSASGSKGVTLRKKNTHAVEGAKAAVQQYFAQSGSYGNIDKTRLDRLLKDLACACNPRNSEEHRLIPNSLLDASIDVTFDLNNAIINYCQEKGCKHEGSLMSSGRV